MDALKPGTPCYLANLQEHSTLTGRVVEVVAPIPAPSGEAGQWYQVRAPWTRELFGDIDTTAPRCNLRPLLPPELAPPEAKKRTPETVSR